MTSGEKPHVHKTHTDVQHDKLFTSSIKIISTQAQFQLCKVLQDNVLHD